MNGERDGVDAGIRRVLGRGGGVDVQQCSRSRVMDGWVGLSAAPRKQGGRVVPAHPLPAED